MIGTDHDSSIAASSAQDLAGPVTELIAIGDRAGGTSKYSHAPAVSLEPLRAPALSRPQAKRKERPLVHEPVGRCRDRPFPAPLLLPHGGDPPGLEEASEGASDRLGEDANEPRERGTLIQEVTV